VTAGDIANNLHLQSERTRRIVIWCDPKLEKLQLTVKLLKKESTIHGGPISSETGFTTMAADGIMMATEGTIRHR
jgi:hypothetical protein